MACVREIQVSGLKVFPGSQWRNAIRYYLDGLWADKRVVSYRPKINITDEEGRSVTLCYEEAETPNEFTYRLRNTDNQVPYGYEKPRAQTEVRMIESGPNLFELEGKLIRFALNDTITVLVVTFEKGEKLLLWKDPDQRGYLGISVVK